MYTFTMKETQNPDGRHTRLEKSKLKVIKTNLDHILSTGEIPSMDILAEESGVSRRSVFRIFQKKEELLVLTNEIFMEEINRKIPCPEADEKRTLDESIIAFLTYRARFNEYINPLRKVLGSRRYTDKTALELREKEKTNQKGKLCHLLDPVLTDHTNRIEIEDILFLNGSWEVWAFLRFDMEFSEEKSLDFLIRQARAAIGELL